MNLISIVIVTWNRANQLKKCLESVMIDSNLKLIEEIIIIDNASTDQTESVVKKFSEKYDSVKVNYTRNTVNQGCPIARNQGLRLVKTKYAYCLDDDGWLTPDALFSISELLESNEKIAIAYSRILDPYEQVNINKVSATKKVGFFNAGATLYRNNALTEVGYFPEYKRQMEESHMAYRVYNKGYEIYSCYDSVMYHLKSKTDKQKREELFLNFNNEFLNYKNLFGSLFVIFFMMLRLPKIYSLYKGNNFSLKEFSNDLCKVTSAVNKHETQYKMGLKDYIRVLYADKYSK